VADWAFPIVGGQDVASWGCHNSEKRRGKKSRNGERRSRNGLAHEGQVLMEASPLGVLSNWQWWRINGWGSAG
ncbi:hypothetical protein Ancab_039038, partial [Ancistrocladus abbreviatus]